MKVTITIEDCGEGIVNTKIDFDPPTTSQTESTLAGQLAVEFMEMLVARRKRDSLAEAETD